MNKFSIILSSLCLLIIIGVQAQDIVITPSDTISVVKTVTILDETVDATAFLKNNQTSKATIAWERIDQSIPSSNSWKTYLCDKENCFELNAKPANEFDLMAGEMAVMKAQFTAGMMPGQGEFTVKAYIVGDSANTVTTITYKADVSVDTAAIIATTDDKIAPRPVISLYPNPARDYLIIKRNAKDKIDRIEIFNILGTKVLSHKADRYNLINRIDIVDFPRGIYMVRVFDDQNNVVLTKSVSKR